MDDNINLCKELGLDFIEINMNVPMFQPDAIDIDKLLQAKEKYNIFYTLHLDDDMDVCSFNDRVSSAYAETVVEAIELAKTLKIPIINIHMSRGCVFTLPSKKIYLMEKYETEYFEKIRKFRELCEATIGDSDIKISVENTHGFLKNMKKGISYLLESDKFSLTYDIGHDVITNYQDLDFIMTNKNKIAHFHYHDAVGSKDHLTFGDGEINLKEKMQLVKELNATCLFEVKTIESLKKSLEYCKSNL